MSPLRARMIEDMKLAGDRAVAAEETTVAEMSPGVDFLTKELGLKKSPVNWCSPADAR
jgi:hypothetical protein